MKRRIELLAPGGDIDSIRAAIMAGADAIYCGLDRFNARNRATNLSFEDLNGVIHLAHGHDCKVFLTLNIILVGSEIPALVKLLNQLVNTGIDGVIIQDLGLFYLLSTYFKRLEIHASTQLNTHNEGQIKFLSRLGARRVNLARELNVDQIRSLTVAGYKKNMLTEVFVHGSYCLCFSGICYLSSVQGGNSGNRGRCSQPCRDRYVTTSQGIDFPLNLKDNSAYLDLRELADAGVASLKIEGRIKKFDYVFTVVNCWKKQLSSFYDRNRLNTDTRELYKVFNRDFSNGYLKGDINKQMFIDNPRDHSIKQFASIDKNSRDKKRVQDKIEYYADKDDIITRVKQKIKKLSIAKIPLTISISGKVDTPLTVSIKTPDTSFILLSKTNLVNIKTRAKSLTHNFLLARLSALNDTAYYIQRLEVENLEQDLFISFKELRTIKKKCLSCLTGLKEIMAPIEVPRLKKALPLKRKPALGILISSEKDVPFCTGTGAKLFFQLSNCFKDEVAGLISLFLDNPQLTPWFPSVLMGKNHGAAINFLEQVKPNRIVTDNTGIAYEAFKRGIPWIAGPYLNMVNSFGLVCLKERFNCYGSFISNEISKYQIKSIVRPENFNLYYRIYHPILLLSSRQCLFHQVIGCEKNRMDEDCIQGCQKSSVITNLKKEPLFIEKTKGNYPCIYHHQHFLNTDIIGDIPDIFSRFFIDLRDIKTETTMEINKSGEMDKSGIIRLFESFLQGNFDSQKELQQKIYPTSNIQYKKGI
jgi:putative protease